MLLAVVDFGFNGLLGWRRQVGQLLLLPQLTLNASENSFLVGLKGLAQLAGPAHLLALPIDDMREVERVLHTRTATCPFGCRPRRARTAATDFVLKIRMLAFISTGKNDSPPSSSTGLEQSPFRKSALLFVGRGSFRTWQRPPRRGVAQL